MPTTGDLELCDIVAIPADATRSVVAIVKVVVADFLGVDEDDLLGLQLCELSHDEVICFAVICYLGHHVSIPSDIRSPLVICLCKDRQLYVE